MTTHRLLAALVATSFFPALAASATSFEEQNQQLFRRLQEVHDLTSEQLAQMRQIFARSGVVGQGTRRSPSIR